MALIKVLRSYFERGAVREAGTVHEVPEHKARELIANGKAERAEVPAAPEPMTSESTPALVKGRPAKEK